SEIPGEGVRRAGSRRKRYAVREARRARRARLGRAPGGCLRRTSGPDSPERDGAPTSTEVTVDHAASHRSAGVVVVGAGPAGCPAAAPLPAAGASVLLVDKARPPRYKTCGGGVVLRAARRAGIDPRADPRLPGDAADVQSELPKRPLHTLSDLPSRALHAVEMHLWDADLHFAVRPPEPVLFTTMRADLDAQLCDAARRAGAEVRAPCMVRGLRALPEGVELQTDSGLLHGRFVIAADGAASRVARWAGWPESQCIP